MIHCDNSQCLAEPSTLGNTRGDAEAAWNQRHTPEITDEDVERANDAYWLARYKNDDKGSIRAALTAYLKGLNNVEEN